VKCNEGVEEKRLFDGREEEGGKMGPRLKGLPKVSYSFAADDTEKFFCSSKPGRRRGSGQLKGGTVHNGARKVRAAKCNETHH